jgi:cytochrome c5
MADEWRGRLTAGRATLLLSVIKGQGGMPPKGGNASLTTAEAEAALAYMLSVPAR